MKGISYWFWMVAGIIGGLIIFTIAYQQIAEINKKNIEQRSLEQFAEIKSIVDNLCKSFAGNKREYTVGLSETVEGIYVASSKYEEYKTGELVDKILVKEHGRGIYLCIKVKDKKSECEQLKCNTDMPFIGAVPEEFSLSALVNKLMGRGKIFDYSLEFERTEDNVSVEFKTDKPLERVCTEILDIKSSGTDVCTISASLTAKNCNGKSWEIKDGSSIKCNGMVDKDTYTKECPTWTVKADAKGGIFTYDLYIDGKIKDSKSIKCSGAEPEPSECSPDKLVMKVDKNLMLENIQYLAQHSRPYGSSGNKKTADYIKNKLESYGLSNVHFEDFDSGKGRNVVGEIGSGETVIVVTGGHRDAESNCPGAVDNAAGTATVMEAARLIASCKDSIKNYKIRFVLFDGEEYGMLGSYAYVEKHSDENINRMLNFDCLGLKGSQGLTVFRTATDLSNSADKACQFVGITCEKKGQAPSESDHAPFGEKGIGYLFAINYGFTCGPCYHCYSCQDDMSQIDSTRLEWAGKLAIYVIADLYIR